MNDKKMIGANIRTFRKAFGETQEELGVFVGLSKTAISNYEKGEREPDRTILERIANHYMIPAENLLYYDFSDINKFSINDKLVWKKLNSFFPIFSSDILMNNKHFKLAYKNHKLLYDEFRKMNFENMKRLYEICLREYIKSYDEKKTNETIANILSIIFFHICGVQGVIVMLENRDSVIKQIIEKDPKYKKVINNMEQSLEGKVEEIKKDLYSPEVIECIDNYIKELKNVKEWRDLADYYLALQYVYNIIDNGMEMQRKYKTGLDMLKAFSSAGNIYANNYMNNSFDALGISPQIVDEWRFW